MPADSASTARIPLCLMAKAPVAGAVKTRMAPPLSPAQAAQLAAQMLRQTVRAACRHWPGEVMLWVSPRPDHPLFVQLAARWRLTVVTQTDGDLGTRMAHALRGAMARRGADAAAVMGCDTPHCPPATFAAAHAMLARRECPVGPAADGGFYLLGLQRGDPMPFANIDWLAEQTLPAVRAHARDLTLSLRDLPPLRDIDRYCDLEYLATIEPAYRAFVAT